MQEENPLKKFAATSLETPGMYLIALRAHLGRGKTMIGEVLNSVADALPLDHDRREADEA